jgi:hypothetical protein
VFFTLLLIVEGTTEKVSQFIMPLMSICKKMLCLKKQKYFLNIAERLNYTITINHQLSVYTSMIHSLLSLILLELALNSLDTLSDVRIKAFTLLF